jgi:hypothetical protein
MEKLVDQGSWYGSEASPDFGAGRRLEEGDEESHWGRRLLTLLGSEGSREPAWRGGAGRGKAPVLEKKFLYSRNIEEGAGANHGRGHGGAQLLHL